MNERVNEWVNEWTSEWMSEWMNEWTSELMSEWMNEWISEWMNEWMNEWINHSINQCVNGWVNEWTNERMNERVNEWANEGMNPSAICVLMFKSASFRFTPEWRRHSLVELIIESMELIGLLLNDPPSPLSKPVTWPHRLQSPLSPSWTDSDCFVREMLETVLMWHLNHSRISWQQQEQ